MMPSPYQRRSLEALLGLFLEATGNAHPEHSPLVSGSALSRFLNGYNWPVRAVIRRVRADIIVQVKAQDRYGSQPVIHLVLDLTTSDKTGKFAQLGSLIRVYNSKRGLHLVVLYILVGQARLPWGFWVYRGRGELTPIQLAQSLIRSLPKDWRQHSRLRVLADTAFGGTDMLRWVKAQAGLHIVVGVRQDRRLAKSGASVQSLKRQGSQVILWMA
jgi:DDE superfamily endonuclease